ncbi:MAG: HD domain-containing phosphohydrolase [candidate division KSB1 bacterium]|jgi:HD-GYP domain-containing protein (c-di-GMP phosphodiesterase class II)|nr:HD domain-containing phosphohydrolase [candidate division KSB1 bacterium]
MRHGQTSLLILSEKRHPEILDVLSRYKGQFTSHYIQNEDDFLQHAINGMPAILIVDQNYYTLTCNVLKKFNAVNIIMIFLGDLEEEADMIFDVVPLPVDRSKLAIAINNARAQLNYQHEIQQLKEKLSLQNKELHELNNIGIALSSERDPDRLLEKILYKSREITRADAGSLYLLEKKEDVPEDPDDYFANKQLRFKLAQNDSVSFEFNEFVMAVEKKSVAGFVALSGQVLNIPDVYELSPEEEYSHNKSFDKSTGYRAKSMLVIPMKTHKDEIIGVLQLINRKKDWTAVINSISIVDEQIYPFDEKCVDLASSLASQAAVSIENTRLYEDIKNLFEGFIKASVHAIEQRDPTTSGHSERVAVLTTALAKAVDKSESNKFKNIHFSRNDIQEINYAALLHDFGKIGVRENILVKAKKLFPHELDRVQNRFRYVKKATALKFSDEKVQHLLQDDKERALEYLHSIDDRLKDDSHRLDEYLRVIIEANEPRVLKEEGSEMLLKIGKIIFEENGDSERLLNDIEIERLSIPRGSLSVEEREEIESHVTHTFNFLSRIPWTSELKNVPQIAYAHHEKLDGSGYPRKLAEKAIPIQSKMMAIADIYDALTAWDRPYKKAVPLEKALDILKWEVDDGKIDPDLYALFLEARLFDLVKKIED